MAVAGGRMSETSAWTEFVPDGSILNDHIRPLIEESEWRAVKGRNVERNHVELRHPSRSHCVRD